MTGHATRDEPARPGEVKGPKDPALMQPDAGIVFIGRIRSAWKERSQCPKNLRQAREHARRGATVEIDAAWRDGLRGLAAGEYVHLLYWMHDAPRNLVVQSPRHREHPTGVFHLRSPARPNPIALALVRIEDIDQAAGTISIDAIDAIDGTPVLDLKPYLPGIDAPAR